MEKIKQLINEAFKSMYSDPDLCIKKSKQALELAFDENNEEAIGMALMHVGLGFYHKFEYDSAIRNYLTAEIFLKESKFRYGLRSLYNNLGVVYGTVGNDEKQLIYFNKNLELIEDTDPPEFSESIFLNIGTIYQNKDQLETASNFFNKALECNKITNSIHVKSAILSNLGILQIKRENFAKAETLINESFEIRKKLKSKIGVIKSLIALIELDIARKAFKDANDKIDKAIYICERENSPRHKVEMLFQRVFIAKYFQNVCNQKDFLLEAAKISKDNNFSKLELKAEKLLQTLFEDCKNYEDAYFCSKEISKIENRINEEKNRIHAAEIDAKFEVYKLEQEKNTILEKNHNLEREIKKRKELVHILCHDLGNPIFLLSSYIDFFKEGDSVESFKQLLKNSIANCIDIIELVRLMEAIDDKLIKFSLEKINLNRTIISVIEDLNFRLKKKNLTIEFIDENPNFVWAERISLYHSVLKNILTNSIKFSKENSKIIVRINKTEFNTILEIEDFGIGIPKDILTNIFKSNVSTNRCGTFGETGTGFGMPLVYKFIDLYGATIEIISNSTLKEVGTLVRLVFKD